MNDLISVIVPVYKVENYIDKCMESVLSQSYENLEIILVDDGSPDRCGDICDEYAKKDARIRVIHKENGGLSSARNAALDVMKGKWVICIDSDDYVHRDYVKKLYEAADRTGADISICGNYQEKGDKLSIEGIICDEEAVYDRNEALLKLVEDTEIKNYAWGKLYRSELFDGVRYPDGRNYEDIATTYLLFDKAERIVRIPYYLYFYLIRNDSISFNKSKKMWHKGCHASCLGQQERCAYFKEKGYEKLYELAQARLLPYLYSDITSGYSDETFEDVIAAKEYIQQNKNEFYANPFISKKDKQLINVYLKNQKQYELYSRCKDSAGQALKLVRKTKVKAKNLFYKGNFGLSDKASKRIVYFELPCFDNLGDHAIAYVAERLLSDFCKQNSEYQLFVVDGWDADRAISALKKCIASEDIIVCQGGGNFGSLYDFAEVFRKKVFEAFSNNKVILMPQTCFYSDDDHGKKALERDRQIIKDCKNITLFARDSKSYEYLKKNFEANVLQIHDTVSLFDASIYESENRNGIVVCLRSDKEGTLHTAEKKQIISVCESIGETFVTDTCTNYTVQPQDREIALANKWKLWGESKLVVTDRLHGMIFALITHTPCIVIGNNHFKVYEAYRTFEECSYLQYIDSLDSLKDMANKLLRTKDTAQTRNNYSEDVRVLFNTLSC